MIPDWRRHLCWWCIIFAGEAIFSLPFHIPRVFKPTVLQAFDISNTALGDAFEYGANNVWATGSACDAQQCSARAVVPIWGSESEERRNEYHAAGGLALSGKVCRLTGGGEDAEIVS